MACRTALYPAIIQTHLIVCSILYDIFSFLFPWGMVNLEDSGMDG